MYFTITKRVERVRYRGLVKATVGNNLSIGNAQNNIKAKKWRRDGKMSSMNGEKSYNEVTFKNKTARNTAESRRM